jgi:hypothetical protein
MTGPSRMFFTPRCSSVSNTATAFCSNQLRSSDSGREFTSVLKACTNKQGQEAMKHTVGSEGCHACDRAGTIQKNSAARIIHFPTNRHERNQASRSKRPSYSLSNSPWPAQWPPPGHCMRRCIGPCPAGAAVPSGPACQTPGPADGTCRSPASAAASMLVGWVRGWVATGRHVLHFARVLARQIKASEPFLDDSAGAHHGVLGQVLPKSGIVRTLRLVAVAPADQEDVLQVTALHSVNHLRQANNEQGSAVQHRPYDLPQPITNVCCSSKHTSA